MPGVCLTPGRADVCFVALGEPGPRTAGLRCAQDARKATQEFCIRVRWPAVKWSMQASWL